MNEKFLNDREKELVSNFCTNKEMLNAVKKVLLAVIYHQGTAKKDEEVTEMNWAFSILNGNVIKSDEQVGQEVRASITALGYLNSGFQRLSEYTTKLPEKKKGNPAL